MASLKFDSIHVGRLPRICVVGPLPPPSGGMANQCEQLVRLLREEGLEVDLVRNNEPYRPAWVGRLPVIRAAFRLFPYLFRLWSAASRAEVMHILANSGWAWHLLAAPAVVIGRIRGAGIIVNYRGGNADPFFSSAPQYVFNLLKKANLRVVPSAFLFRVFARYGMDAEIISNIIDLSRFVPVAPRIFGDAPHLIVTRNLEPIYDIPMAIHAFAHIRAIFSQARLTVAGSGPELERLQALVTEQGLDGCVTFPGRIENADIPALYNSADCLLNPSTVDNMPISLLEAFASGVPVVSTDAGGIPDMAEHGVSALLVPVGDDTAMADKAIRVLREPDLATKLRRAGLEEVSKYAWPQVRTLWLNTYCRVAATKEKNMSVYTLLCSGVLFPLHEWLKGHDSVALRRQLEDSQWWPVERLKAYRVERLRGFLQDIGQRVPYYRELFKSEGFNPAAIQIVADLHTLPLLTKPLIRENIERLKAEGHGLLTRYNTGGSSGEPLIFYMGKARKSHDVAAKWRATRWWGVDIGDREMVVWGSPIELGAQDRGRRIRDGLLRSRLLPAFEMSPANLDRFVDAIRAYRPAMLFGYPSSLALIAGHARSKGLAMNRLGIRVAFVTSEKLYDEQRATISTVFGCPVANGYGARDAGFIAHECPSGSLHISAEDLIVETVHPDGTPTEPGEAGEIVITHMATGEFPLLRYRTGDVGILSNKPCACGRTLPVLSEVQGRTTDFVVAMDGTVMHGLALIYTVRDLPGVESFKIVQESIEHTDVQIVAGPDFTEADGARIERDFRARLGQGVRVTVRRVAEIAPEQSGKFRYVVSKVPVATNHSGAADATS